MFGLREAVGVLPVDLLIIDLYQCTKDKVWSTKIMGVSTWTEAVLIAAKPRLDLIGLIAIARTGSTKQEQEER
jgi:hypothetical protein